MAQTYSGGCQCGKVRYEVQMDIGEVLACNCSRCGRLGSLLAFAPATQFKLLSGDADLTKFEFNKHMIQHQFCCIECQSLHIVRAPRDRGRRRARECDRL
jgi:hypothetical protein